MTDILHNLIRHDISSGIKRLTICMDYLSERRGAYLQIECRIPDYIQLGLELSSRTAMDWWVSSIETKKTRGFSQDAALDDEYLRFPAGPASHPEFIDAVRAAWFDVLSATNPGTPTVRAMPGRQIVESQVDRSNPLPLMVLTAMPYWPIGLDENGNWC